MQKEKEVNLENLKVLIAFNKLSMRELAKIMKLKSKESVRLRLSGKVKINLVEAKLIADYFKMDLNELFFK